MSRFLHHHLKQFLGRPETTIVSGEKYITARRGADTGNITLGQIQPPVTSPNIRFSETVVSLTKVEPMPHPNSTDNYAPPGLAKWFHVIL